MVCNMARTMGLSGRWHRLRRSTGVRQGLQRPGVGMLGHGGVLPEAVSIRRKILMSTLEAIPTHRSTSRPTGGAAGMRPFLGLVARSRSTNDQSVQVIHHDPGRMCNGSGVFMSEPLLAVQQHTGGYGQWLVCGLCANRVAGSATPAWGTLERKVGLEPTPSAWKADVLPITPHPLAVAGSGRNKRRTPLENITRPWAVPTRFPRQPLPRSFVV